MKQLTPQDLIAEWQCAYREAHGKEPPALEYWNGWFRWGYSKTNYRRKTVEEAIRNLRNMVTKEEPSHV